MSSLKCVVEGCNLEYDVICSFSFYKVNTTAKKEEERQTWVAGAMKDEKESLWRHVSLQLCGYHFEMDNQGLWIDSPMLPELLKAPKPTVFEATEQEKCAMKSISQDHNYTKATDEKSESVSRLNVRHLVDSLGYLSLKNLQKKQLWVVKVDSDKTEATISDAEHVEAKKQEHKQIIEIIPQNISLPTPPQDAEVIGNEQTDTFDHEVSHEEEIGTDQVKDTQPYREWKVNIVTDPNPTKYTFKRQTQRQKKRHFTSELNEISWHGEFDNYFIIPNEIEEVSTDDKCDWNVGKRRKRSKKSS